VALHPGQYVIRWWFPFKIFLYSSCLIRAVCCKNLRIQIAKTITLQH
jgi:hypothetical protein